MDRMFWKLSSRVLPLIPALVIFASVLLGSHQARALTKQADTSDIKLAKYLISKACGFGRGEHHFSDTELKATTADEITIRSITKGHEGWWEIGYMYEDLRDYFFINFDTEGIFCGEERFRKIGGHHWEKVEGPISGDALLQAYNLKFGFIDDVKISIEPLDKNNTSAGSKIEERLSNLKNLVDKGLLTNQEAAEKRKEILEGL